MTDEFLPHARDIGAGLVRVYVYWNQVEPEPGRYDWTVVDALLNQVDGEEIWLTVCASSTWATRQPTSCPPELEDLRHRIACRQLVSRTLLALAGGVRRTVYWHLAPETPGEIDYHQLMGLMFGKLNLLAYEGRALTRRNPAADTFALLAGHLANATEVTMLGDHAVRLGGTVVAWDHPHVPWPAETAQVTDVFGKPAPATVRAGRVHLQGSDTPVFITV